MGLRVRSKSHGRTLGISYSADRVARVDMDSGCGNLERPGRLWRVCRWRESKTLTGIEPGEGCERKI